MAAYRTTVGNITYRSFFESQVAATLGPEWQYESIKLPYVIEHTYTPDFIDPINKQIIEVKGRLDPSERAKLLAVVKQNPDWEVTVLFQYPNTKIAKGSKTSYAEWAAKNGIKWRSL